MSVWQQVRYRPSMRYELPGDLGEMERRTGLPIRAGWGFITASILQLAAYWRGGALARTAKRRPAHTKPI